MLLVLGPKKGDILSLCASCNNKLARKTDHPVAIDSPRVTLRNPETESPPKDLSSIRGCVVLDPFVFRFNETRHCPSKPGPGQNSGAYFLTSPSNCESVSAMARCSCPPPTRRATSISRRPTWTGRPTSRPRWPGLPFSFFMVSDWSRSSWADAVSDLRRKRVVVKLLGHQRMVDGNKNTAL